MDWPILIPDARKAVWDAATEDDRTAATNLAVRILHGLTGRVFGLITDTVRPCSAPSPAFSTYGGHYRVGTRTASGLVQGPLLLSSCGCTTSPCPCAGASEVALPGPVAEIVSVSIDGTALGADDYKVRDHRWLVRVDGTRWPQHQDMNVADDAVGAFTVTYKRGIVPPADGQVAAGLLALEVLAAMKGKGPCALPNNVKTVARQGVTIEVDPVAYMDEGLTGIPQVDQWIRSVNPNRMKAAPVVLSPDSDDRVARFS